MVFFACCSFFVVGCEGDSTDGLPQVEEQNENPDENGSDPQDDQGGQQGDNNPDQGNDDNGNPEDEGPEWSYDY